MTKTKLETNVLNYDEQVGPDLDSYALEYARIAKVDWTKRGSPDNMLVTMIQVAILNPFNDFAAELETWQWRRKKLKKTSDRPFTWQEMATIRNALGIAAGEYEKHAAVLDDHVDPLTVSHATAGSAFRGRAAAARELLKKVRELEK